MVQIWPVTMAPEDKVQVTALSERLARLGLVGPRGSYVGAIRVAVKLALSASDDDLKRGEL